MHISKFKTSRFTLLDLEPFVVLSNACMCVYETPLHWIYLFNALKQCHVMNSVIDARLSIVVTSEVPSLRSVTKSPCLPLYRPYTLWLLLPMFRGYRASELILSYLFVRSITWQCLIKCLYFSTSEASHIALHWSVSCFSFSAKWCRFSMVSICGHSWWSFIP